MDTNPMVMTEKVAIMRLIQITITMTTTRTHQEGVPCRLSESAADLVRQEWFARNLTRPALLPLSVDLQLKLSEKLEVASNFPPHPRKIRFRSTP
jgi:hypothetical protein